MNILLTGASSFTGSWIAQAFASRGKQVIAPVRASLEMGMSRRGRNLARAAEFARVFDYAPVGSSKILDIIAKFGPFELACFHGAEVGNFKGPNFDALAALEANTANFSEVLRALAAQGCRKILITGSVFEPGEGNAGPGSQAIGAYGLSKKLSFETMRFHAHEQHFTVGKFTIAHPYGPGEKPGLNSHFIQSWLRRSVPQINHPQLVRDFAPVKRLAWDYANFGLDLPNSEGLVHFAPSYDVLTIQEFAEQLGREIEPIIGRKCPYLTRSLVSCPSEPTMRTNIHEPFAPDLKDLDPDFFVVYVTSHQILENSY